MGALLGCKSNFFGNRVAEPAMVPLAVVPVPGVAVRGNQPAPPPNPGLRPITGMKTAEYAIRKGDTLWSIARAHRTTVLTLQRLNGINGSFIRYGDTLRVPAEGAALLAKEKPAAAPEPAPIPEPVPAPAPEPAPAPAKAKAKAKAGDGLGFGAESAPRPKPKLQKDKDGFIRLPPQP